MPDPARPAPTVLGVDIGGTTIKAWGIVDGAGRPAGDPVPTPTGDPTGVRTADTVAGLLERAATRFGPPAAVGIAAPGLVDDGSGTVVRSVNLEWRHVPIRDLVAARVAAPVVLTHDVRAGAVAEKRSGAGAGRGGGLLFAALGTGLAVANVDASGRPVGSGWAGEVGQLRLLEGPARGGRVEEVASAGGLARRFGAAGAAGVLRAREAGDPRAARLWDETVELVADVLAWSFAVLAPPTIVVGGGLALAGDALFAPLRRRLAARLADFPEPAVLPAVHGPAAAAVGAADLALLATTDHPEGAA
jgi:glucokinase